MASVTWSTGSPTGPFSTTLGLVVPSTHPHNYERERVGTKLPLGNAAAKNTA
jgi:hypothetical protein